MRKLSTLFFALMIAVVGVGCDSNDDPSDAEAFVGVWALTNVEDADGSQLQAFGAAFSSVVLTNSSDNSFVLNVTPREGDPLTVPGTYVVNENTNSFTLNANLGGQAIPLAFTYAYTSDNVVTLTGGATTAVLLNQLFGTSLVAPAVITITRQ
ncbi:MAG: hypothetical protein JJ896_17330 [Rhodothermales bacterium]|nr:hypothetical protein [Rhodothermales bacterium]MBO6781424.1 hypothetical protein [Rhodothermales bacterium]